MSSGMPELGSKISLISKADIRYEGRLFTVDPQECTIALASVRSFGTEDRETQYPVAPQSQVYDYILFRGSDIKDIRVLNNVPSLPQDPAIMQMSMPPSLGGGTGPSQFGSQFNHPIVGQPHMQHMQYHSMGGITSGMHTQMNKTSELSPQTSVDLAPQQPITAPIGSGVAHFANQVKDQGSMLDLIGGGSQQSLSRSGTPSIGHRKSPTADQGTQVTSGASGSGQQRESRRGSNSGPKQHQPGQQQQSQQGFQGQQQQPGNQRNRTNSRNRQRYPSGSGSGGAGAPGQHGGQHPGHQGQHAGQHVPAQQHHPMGQHNQHMMPHNQHPGGVGGYNNRGGNGWRGRARGRGRGFVPRTNNKLKFDNDYDFEQANTEFEELRNQLAKAKISDGEAKPEGEVDKKDDSGNETGAGEPEVEEDAPGYAGYNKAKSFFDNISCDAVERSVVTVDNADSSLNGEQAPAYDKKASFFDNISCDALERSMGRSQRTDWRTERKLNSETFGVASARRGAWRGRGQWRQYSHHQPWRPMRGVGGGNNRGRGHNPHQQQHNQHNPQQSGNNRTPRINQPQHAAPQPAAAAAK